MPPVAPKNLRLISSGIANVGDIAFAWDAVPGASGYHLLLEDSIGLSVRIATSRWTSTRVFYSAANIRSGWIGAGAALLYRGRFEFSVSAYDGTGVGPAATLERSNYLNSEPDDPDGERVTNIGRTSATLTFGSDDLPEAEYEYWAADIRWRKQGSTSWTTRNADTETRRQLSPFSITGLTESTTYEVEVRWVDVLDANQSGWDRRTFTTTSPPPLVRPPAVPTGLGTTDIYSRAVTTNSISMGWRAVTGATVYDLRYRKDNTGAWTTIENLTSNSRLVSNLESNTSYTFQVRAGNSAGDSAWSGNFTTSTMPDLLPAPTGLGASSIGQNSLTLSWRAVTGATGYDIRYRRSGTTDVYRTISNITGTSREITGLAANTGYTFNVRTRNADGAGAWSINFSVDTEPEPARDANPPRNLVAVRSSTSVALDWDAPTGDTTPTNYTVQFKLSLNSVWSTAATVTATAHNVTGLSTSTSYDFRVRANYSHGSSAWVSVTGVETLGGLTAPDVPTGLGLTAAYDDAVTTDSISLGWAPAARAVDYDIRYRRDDRGGYTFLNNLTANQRIVTGLASGTSYTFEVRAGNTAGHSGWSVKFTTDTKGEPGPTITGPGAKPPPVPPPDSSTTGSGLWIDLTTADDPEGDVLSNVEDDVLRYTFGWGRQEEAFRAICLPLRGQVILDNSSGRYDPDRIRPGARVWLDQNIGESTHPVARGFVRQVLPSVDFDTGLEISTIHVEGILGRLAKNQYEVGLFERDTVRTGQVITDALNAIRYPSNLRRIDAGQARIHPAFYSEILSARQLTTALGVLRGTEQAEVDGLIHEERGNVVVFEDAYHRELDDRDPVITFGASQFTENLHGSVMPVDSWRNVYTVVRVGAERFRLHAPGVVLEYRKGFIEDDPLRIPARSTDAREYSLLHFPEYRGPNNAHQVAAWLPIEASHHQFRTAAGNVITTGITITITEETRFHRVIQIANTNAFDIFLTKLELHGRGVSVFGDATFEHEDTAASAVYDRRILELPATFIGQGVHHQGDAVEEGRDAAMLLLVRYSKPKPAARLRFIPTEEQLVSLQVGDPIRINPGIGLPPDTYYMEGGEVHYDAATDIREMGVHVSRRGRKRLLKNLSKNIRPSGWTQVDPPLSVEEGRYYIFAAQVSGSIGGDDVVLRLMHDGQAVKQWTAEDIDSTAYYLGGIIRPEKDGTAYMEARGGVSVTGYKVARVES